MDKLYTIQEVAAKLGVSDKTLRRWEEAGRFTPSRTLGNQRRYNIEDLQILDAIKHGTINSQSDLLTIAQAAGICGVTPTTLMRWENDGKIHPFITSHNTYYPRTKLVEKMDELKKSSVVETIAPEPDLSTNSQSTNTQSETLAPPVEMSTKPPEATKTPSITPLALATTDSAWQLDPRIWNLLITLILILSYHFLFNTASSPVSPAASTPPSQGAVQGVQAPDPKLDILEKKLQDHLADEMLNDAKPQPVTTINLDNTALISGAATLPKGKEQVTLTSDQITADTPITATFTSDFAPAKKYWITTNPGSFTLHTDFPVGADTSFNYSFLTIPIAPSPSSTPAATATPSAVLR